MKKYRITGHNSFYLREGWINKIFSKLYNNETENELEVNYFSKNNAIELINKLGIGSAMVDSIKFWAEVMNIIEKKDNKLVLSKVAKQILINDKYLENNNSLWLLHFNLLNKSDDVMIIWEMVFKNGYAPNFTKELLEERLKRIYKEEERVISDSSLHESINIFIKTYCQKHNENNEDYEENISSPFKRLNYIVETVNKEYKIRNIMSNEISDYLIYYIIYICIIKENKSQNQISITDSYNAVNEKIRMSYLEYEKKIKKLESLNLIKIDRAAGLENIIFIENDFDKETIEEELLKNILKAGI